MFSNDFYYWFLETKKLLAKKTNIGNMIALARAIIFF